MFDIFEDKPKPKIYCCDVVIEVKVPARGKQKKYDTIIVKLYNISLVMNDGDIATQKQKTMLFKKIFDKHIHRGDFENAIFTIKDIKVLGLMGNVAYDFDYLLH
jgi:hypothetical protein